jgi:hypothetical protein
MSFSDDQVNSVIDKLTKIKEVNSVEGLYNTNLIIDEATIPGPKLEI